MKILPKKLLACQELINKMMEEEDAKYFLQPMEPTNYNVTKEQYEKSVKQPMDLATILKRLSLPQDQAQAYKNVSTVSKDVNRIFGNVMKVWSPGQDEIADASQRLQSWWIAQWQELVPVLMKMKVEDDCYEKESEKNDPDASATTEGCSAAINNERSDDYQEQIGMPEEVRYNDGLKKKRLTFNRFSSHFHFFLGKHERLGSSLPYRYT
jgi:hypothetical protein